MTRNEILNSNEIEAIILNRAEAVAGIAPLRRDDDARLAQGSASCEELFD
jgi:hypothetical protein